MKIQFLNGGLANQAFQYIFARHYELAHPGEVMYLDDSYFALNTVHNGYELGKVFGVTPHMLSECFDEEVWSYILEQKRQGKSVPQILCENGIGMYMLSEVGEEYKSFNPFSGHVINTATNLCQPKVQELPGDVYYHGYWINKWWFRRFEEVFLRELTFPKIEDEKNAEYAKNILATDSLAIHVRRGDYVTLGLALQAEQYRSWIAQFLDCFEGDWEGYVFSDDIAWCRKNAETLGLTQLRRVTYVEGNVRGENYRDMQLMSLCRGMILSNSAFCYLAAQLSRRKLCLLNPTTRET